MLGLGEKESEVTRVMQDLLSRGCDILTMGQYLSPSKDHQAVKEFLSQEKFDSYYNIAKSLGFKAVLSAPLVRSSFYPKVRVLIQ